MVGIHVTQGIPNNLTDYGEMGNVYGSSATEIIPSADEWCAMYHTNITGSAARRLLSNATDRNLTLN